MPQRLDDRVGVVGSCDQADFDVVLYDALHLFCRVLVTLHAEFHDKYPCAHIYSLIDIVGDHDDQLSGYIPHIEDFPLHFHACERVQRAEGLIEEQDFRLSDQSAAQGALCRVAAKRLRFPRI